MTTIAQYSLFNPGPVQTSSAVKTASVSADLCHRSPQFSQLLQRVRSDLSSGLKPVGEAVLVPGSATFALEAAVASFTEPGSRCLVASNGTYGQRLVDICRTHDRPTAVVESPIDAPLNFDRVQAALADGEVDCLLVVHHETSSGQLNELTELSASAGRAGVRLIVDAVSSFGAEALDLDCPDWCVIASSNKCVESLPGLGLVLASQSMWAAVSPAGVYSLDLTKYLIGQRAGTVAFTPPVNAILALDAALAELSAEGVTHRRARYTAGLDYVTEGFARLGLRRLVPPERSASSLAAFTVPAGMSFGELFDRFYAEGIVLYGAHAPLDDSHFRVSVMGHKPPADLRHLVSTMDAVTNRVPQ